MNGVDPNKSVLPRKVWFGFAWPRKTWTKVKQQIFRPKDGGDLTVICPIVENRKSTPQKSSSLFKKMATSFNWMMVFSTNLFFNQKW